MTILGSRLARQHDRDGLTLRRDVRFAAKARVRSVVCLSTHKAVYRQRNGMRMILPKFRVGLAESRASPLLGLSRFLAPASRLINGHAIDSHGQPRLRLSGVS